MTGSLDEAVARAGAHFFSLSRWQERVPDEAVIAHLTKIETAAISVVRHGVVLLSDESANLYVDLSDVIGENALPRRSVPRFQQALTRLQSYLPNREDVPEDEFGDRKLANALGQAEDHGEAALIALARVIMSGGMEARSILVAAANLARRARAGIAIIGKVRKHVVPKRHVGDFAFNAWLDQMLAIYEDHLGKTVGMSVNRVKGGRQQEPTGPLLRFLVSAYSPLVERMEDLNKAACERYASTLSHLSPAVQNLRLNEFPEPFPKRLTNISASSWRSRVRTALQHRASRQSDLIGTDAQN